MKAIVTVVGKDTVGIIADVCSQLAACGVNVLDISQTVLHGYFTMIMMADLDGASTDFAHIAEQLAENGKKRGLDIRMQREDLFQAMHRI
ncbi:MAG: ACT domain-containing protein [Oscillospiraceae bacterium]|nr:ACT domain-containing protein [Oscillospiraceae bacterium]